MVFILTNIKCPRLKKNRGIYYCAEVEVNPEYTLYYSGLPIRDGYLMKPAELLQEYNKYGVDFFQFTEGRYLLCSQNNASNELTIVNDPLGTNDMFLYEEDTEWMITDKFRYFSDCKLLNLNANIDALIEFLIFEYPLYGHTFWNEVKWAPNASILRISPSNSEKTLNQYWEYVFTSSDHYNMNTLDRLFNKSIEQIIRINPNSTYGIGLSGGLDSRLVAKYAVNNGIDIRAFNFGEENSDADFIANKIAVILKIEYQNLGVNHDF